MLAWWFVLWSACTPSVPTPPAEIPDADWATLSPDDRWVRLKGTLHYEAMLTTTEGGGLFGEPTTWRLVGFFPVNDTVDREIRVLLKTTRPPEKLVTYETLTAEGRLVPPTRRTLSPRAETLLSEKVGYFFADELRILEVTRLVTEDGEYVEGR